MTAKRVATLWIACLAGWLEWTHAAESPRAPAPQAAAQAGAAASHIQRWIAELDSDRFAQRQAATAHLQHSGEPAIAALAEAADGSHAEVTRRAIDVLAALSDSEELTVAQSAREALSKLAESTHRLAASRAAVVLREQHLRQQRAALVELRNLGADIQIGGVEDGELIVHRVLLGRAWQGGDEALRLLPRVRRIDELKLYGQQFTDASLDAIAELTGLQVLRLYCTGITDAGQERLAAAFPGAMIDFRRGALLGVRSLAFGNGNGCRIESVTPDSAAAAAGLQPNDIIVQLDEGPIQDMNALIAGIARHRPGDRVQVTFLRDDEKTTREVVLGELGEREE
ncbi:MAG TPA: PDZ domain-containing protein [Pirellulales bacterium]|nr:PDZ domain-containing protein [Pirellulales bacterium]